VFVIRYRIHWEITYGTRKNNSQDPGIGCDISALSNESFWTDAVVTADNDTVASRVTTSQWAFTATPTGKAVLSGAERLTTAAWGVVVGIAVLSAAMVGVK
jgi:hypothetical protein